MPDGTARAPVLSRSCRDRDMVGRESRMIPRGLYERGRQARRRTRENQKKKQSKREEGLDGTARLLFRAKGAGSPGVYSRRAFNEKRQGLSRLVPAAFECRSIDLLKVSASLIPRPAIRLLFVDSAIELVRTDTREQGFTMPGLLSGLG